jgi:hypothetical protein
LRASANSTASAIVVNPRPVWWRSTLVHWSFSKRS